MSAYEKAHIDEMASNQWPYWIPIRHHFGIDTFGINLWRGREDGTVIPEHAHGDNGEPELYYVVDGHATFTVAGEEVDAPAGTLVFLDDVKVRRHAVAKEPGTTVLAIGGVPGKHEPSAWEYFFPALPAMRDGDHDTARRILEEGLAEKDAPVIHYQLACVEALAGNRERALEELHIAVDANERYREAAKADGDFASIRDDPRFPA
jgi:cupin domain